MLGVYERGSTAPRAYRQKNRVAMGLINQHLGFSGAICWTSLRPRARAVGKQLAEVGEDSPDFL
jgi:hypothetical protein